MRLTCSESGKVEGGRVPGPSEVVPGPDLSLVSGSITQTGQLVLARVEHASGPLRPPELLHQQPVVLPPGSEPQFKVGDGCVRAGVPLQYKRGRVQTGGAAQEVWVSGQL